LTIVWLGLEQQYVFLTLTIVWLGLEQQYVFLTLTIVWLGLEQQYVFLALTIVWLGLEQQYSFINDLLPGIFYLHFFPIKWLISVIAYFKVIFSITSSVTPCKENGLINRNIASS
jgi:hypothetical protein